MFRKMRRFKQQVSQEECIQILQEQPRGILSVLGDDDYPYGFPINYFYDDGKLYFHCAKVGHKIDALRKHPKASFCVYNKGFQKEGEWAWNITSVICFGQVRFIDDFEKTVELVRTLGLKYYPNAQDVEVEIEKAVARVQMLAFDIEHMTGKLVNES